MALTLRDMIGRQKAATARSLRRGGALAAVLAVSVVLLAAALGCAIAALWLAVSPFFGPAGAALVSALALLLMAGLTLLLAERLNRQPVGQIVAPGLDDLSGVFSADKANWLSAALIAGLMAGRHRP